MQPSARHAALLLLLVAACSSKIDSTNPYDPGTPSTQKAKASVHGKIAAPSLSPPITVQVTLATNNAPFAQQQTAADGGFVFSDLPPGAYSLLASPTGFVPLTLPLTLAPGDDIDLKDVELTVVTGPTLATLSGVVTLGSNSTDNSGILVEAVVESGATFTTQTNTAGAWQLSVAPGGYTLHFSHKDFIPSAPKVISALAGAQVTVPQVALAYDPATVSGVVDAELPAGGTAPLADATVTLDSTGVTGVSGGAGPGAGAFSLTGIPAGSYVLRALKPGFEADTQPVLNLTGHEVRTLTAHLVLKLAHGQISGRALAAGGAGAAGVQVQLGGGPSAGTVVTGDDGRYAFSGLLTGTYSLALSADGFVPATIAVVEVKAGEVATPADVTLAPNPGSVSGAVVGELPAGGTGPLAGVHLSLDGTALSGVSDQAGAFSLGGIPTGSYLLRATLAGYGAQTQPVLNLAGGEARVLPIPAFVLKVGRGAIAGSVQLADSLSDASGVTVQLSGGPSSGSALTGPDGKFAFGNLFLGVYTVTASRPGYQPVVLGSAVTVTADGTSNLAQGKLQPDPATVLGQVTAENASGGLDPVQGAAVSLDGVPGATTVTNVTGGFSLPVPVGSYVVRVHAAGFADATQPALNLLGGEKRTLAAPFQLSLLRGAIAGTVKLPDTGDASGIVVELTGATRALVTGQDGTYRFDNLLANTYQVTARHDGYQRKVLAAAAVVAGTGVTNVPSATLDKQGGAVTVTPYTKVRTVALALNAPKADAYLLSEDPNFADPALGDVSGSSTPHAFGGTGTASFTLSNVEGVHSIYVSFLAAGVPAPLSSAQTVLDRVAPSAGLVAINGGSGFTNASGGIVTLALSAKDVPPAGAPGAQVSGLGQMRLANDAATVLGAPAVQFNLTTTWTLDTPNNQGQKTVCVVFIDNAGNESAPACTQVIYDTVAPGSPSIALLGGAQSAAKFSNSSIVTVSLGATDTNAGAGNANLLVRLSNTQGFAGATYQPFQPTLTWLLPPGDGPKTVYAQFLDPAGNPSGVVSDTLTLDTAPPASPAITITETDSRPGNGFTNNLSVTLNLMVAPEPAAAHVAAVFSEDPSFTGAVPVSISSGVAVQQAFALGGNGARTVYARYLDLAGNPSATVSASVVVDRTPPDASVLPRLSPSGVSGSTSVSLVLPTAGQDEVQIAGTGVVFVGPAPFVAGAAGAVVPFTLTPADGTKAIAVTYRDLADNTAGPIALSLALEVKPPVATNFTVTGTDGDGAHRAGHTAVPSVTLNFSGEADAVSGLTQMRYGFASDVSDGAWQAFAPAPALTLPSPDGLKTVYAQFQNGVGNPSNIVQGTVALDTTATVKGSLQLEGAAGSLAGSTVSVSGTALSAATAADGSFTLSSVPSGTQTFVLGHAGYETQLVQLPLAPGSTVTLPQATLPLSRGQVAGTLLLAGFADASGIAVTIHSTSTSATTLTGSSGAFSSGSLPVGTYAVDAAKAPDWQPVSVANVVVARNAVTTLPGSPLTLQPVASSSLAGNALLEQQANASGTTVTLSGTDFRGVAASGSALTNAAGAFSFPGLRAGGYQLTFSQAGFDSPAPVGVSVVTGQAASIGTLTLAASRGSVAGTVTATGAADQSGTVVNVSGGLDSASTVTDGAGNFRIDRLRIGPGYSAVFSRAAYAKVTSASFAVAANAATAVPAATLSLATTGSISGSALVARPAGANAGILISLTGADVNGASVVRSTNTVASGAYTFSALPAGTYALAFSKASYDPQQSAGLAVSAAAVTAPTVTLAVSTGTISGSAALSAGAIAGFAVGSDYSGAVVTLSGTDVPVPAAVTDSSGKYQFTGVPVSLSGAQFTVSASKPYYTSASTSVTGAANTTVTVASTLTLSVAAGTLGGTALLYDNTSHDGHTANATSAGVAIAVTGTAFNGSSFSAGGSSGASGAWSIGSLPPGSYQALATSTNRACAGYGTATVPASGSGAAGTIQCVDALAPSALLLGAPNVPAGAQAGYVTATSVTVPIATPATDATSPASNLQGYQVALADAANLSGAPIIAGQPASLTFNGLVANARNVLWARAIDWVGNAGPATSVTVTTDGVTPPTPAILTPRSVVNATTSSVTIAGSESDANFAGYQSCASTHAATFSCAASADCVYAASPASFAVSLTANQKTCLYAQALDRAGNTSGTAAAAITSDLTSPTPPSFSPSYDPFKLSVRTPYVDFFNTAAATDAPGAGGAWQGIAYIEVDTGSGYQALCPQAACSAGGAWSPCSCACSDARLRCDQGVFTGVRATLAEGTSTTVAFRAVDLAGNVGAGVAQQVFSDATGDVVSAAAAYSYDATVHGTLVGYEQYVVGVSTEGWLLDLGPNRRVDATDKRCRVAASVVSGLGRTVVPVHAGLVTWSDGNNLYIDRPGADGAFCTADDATSTLYSAGIYGAPPANTFFDGVVGSGERLAWSSRNFSTGKYTLVVAEPGSTGLIGAAADTKTSIATFDQLNALEMGGRAVAISYATCSGSCTFGWRVYSARNAAGTFSGGTTAFDLTTLQNPGDYFGVSLSSDGSELAHVEPGGVLVVRQPGADGIYGTADDVVTKTTAPWPVGTSVAVDGPNLVALGTGSPQYLVHWSSGPDGVWGTADDVVERTHPTATARQQPWLSDGLLTFNSGSDILDIDLSTFRWEQAPTQSLYQSNSPLVANNAGTLFYMTAYGSQSLVARTSAGTETQLATSATAVAADANQLVEAEQSGTPGLWVHQPDASGKYFSGSNPAPVLLYGTGNYVYDVTVGGGKAISLEMVNTPTSTCAGFSPCGVVKIFDPGAGGLLKSAPVAFNPYPGAPATVGENLNWERRPAINAAQAFFICNGINTNLCVYGAGADGKFGTADDVPATYLRHPGTGTLFSSPSLVVSGTRMLITETTPPGLYLLDAGPDGLFNTADDKERKLASIGLYDGAMWLSGNWATYLNNGGAGGQQVYLVSGFDGPAYLLSSHYSTKRAPVVDFTGRTFWIDGIFMPEGIMVRAP